eukprot:4501313-Pleurochrysis_carterae.AAC.3
MPHHARASCSPCASMSADAARPKPPASHTPTMRLPHAHDAVATRTRCVCRHARTAAAATVRDSACPPRAATLRGAALSAKSSTCEVSASNGHEARPQDAPRSLKKTDQMAYQALER